jgi:AcrR family transcriptional regulator
MTTTTLGLRDRKRLETRARLETAAVELVLRDGIENATIDAISEHADVSPRTFFNYFDCKEDAILGLRDVEVTDEVVRAHIVAAGDADLVESIVAMLFTTIGQPISDPATRATRLELVLRHPQLLGRQFAQMTRMAEQLTAAVRVILAHHDGAEESGTDSPAAELMLAICGSGVRVAVMELAAAHGDADPNQLQKRAVELVREVIQKLQ